ncbi:MAG TPA: LysR family transcriptional regulator [Solirubrobacteraceae bacterium]|nr:LysR family transcriptional regulator [Solirubrobacteraceae bacterium]
MWELAELRELRVFLTLYEELHFGRTAERLRLSQTRVSQTIQELETKLGTPLFLRTSRRVEPTPAGRQLHEQAGPIYEQLRHVLREIHDAPREIAGELRLGLDGPSSGGQALPEIISLFTDRHPDCTVQVAETGIGDPTGQLRRGEFDLVALDLPVDQPDLVLGPILRRDGRLIGVASNHPLAGRESVTLEDIADYETHDGGGTQPPEKIDAWSPPRTPDGRPIRRRHLTKPTFSQIFALVAAGEIVHFASDPLFLTYPGITYRPITDMPPIESALAWLASEETAATRAFTQAARDTLGIRFT